MRCRRPPPFPRAGRRRPRTKPSWRGPRPRSPRPLRAAALTRRQGGRDDGGPSGRSGGVVGGRRRGEAAVGAVAAVRGEAADGPAAVRAVEEEAAQLRRRPRPPGPLHHGQRAARLGAAGVQALPPARRAVRGPQERGAGRDGVLGADDGVGPGREAAAAAAPLSAAPRRRRRRSRLLLLQLPAELLQQRLHARDLRAQVGQRRRAPRARQHGPPAQRRQQHQHQRRHGPRRRRRRRRRARLPPPAPSSAARGGAGPARLPGTAVLSTRRPEQLRRAGPTPGPPRRPGPGRGRPRARWAAGGVGELRAASWRRRATAAWRLYECGETAAGKALRASSRAELSAKNVINAAGICPALPSNHKGGGGGRKS